MFDAQLLRADLAFPSVASEVYGPWFDREADNAMFTLEVVETEICQIEVAVFHKNFADTGDGSQVGTTISRTTVGRETAEYTGLKELVRYRFTTSATVEGSGWVLHRMLQPVWFDTVRA